MIDRSRMHRALDAVMDRHSRVKDTQTVIETYRGYEIERGETNAIRVVGLGHSYAQYFKGWSEKSAVDAAKRAIDRELARPAPQRVKPEDLIMSVNDPRFGKRR